jgi:hypothetical protein
MAVDSRARWSPTEISVGAVSTAFIAIIVWGLVWLSVGWPATVSCWLPEDDCPIFTGLQISWTNADDFVRPDTLTFAKPPVATADRGLRWDVLTTVPLDPDDPVTCVEATGTRLPWIELECTHHFE